MVFSDFQTMVEAYINRSAVSFVRGSLNLVQLAANDAKREAQMKLDFHQLQTYGYFLGTDVGTPLATGIYSDPALQNVMSVKKILSVWQFDNTSSAPRKIRNVNMMLESDMAHLLPSLMNRLWEPRLIPVTFKFRAYVYGGMVYVTGLGAIPDAQPTQPLMANVVQFLPDYVNPTDTDLFLQKYQKWMLFATLQQLNAYLPDGEQLQISTTILDRQWDIVVADDENMVQENDSVNSLD